MAKQLTTIAWAAGLFEGEGNCRIGTRGRPVVQLRMTDEDVVRRFADAVGCGNVKQYPGYHGNQPTWAWYVTSKDNVLQVLGALWPYLGERRLEQATEVIERAVKIRDHVGYCRRKGHDLSLPEHRYLHAKTGKVSCRTCSMERARVRYRGRVQ